MRAAPLLAMATMSVLHVGEFVEYRVDCVEPLVPRLLEARDPVTDRLERVAIDPIQALTARITNIHETDFAKNAEVLRDLWLRQAENLDEIVHRPLAAGQDLEDLPPPGFCDRIERVGGRRRSGHGSIYICPYRHM